MPDDGTHGIELGKIHTTDVAREQQWLVAIANTYGTPRKMLIIHQFAEYNLDDRDSIGPL